MHFAFKANSSQNVQYLELTVHRRGKIITAVISNADNYRKNLISKSKDLIFTL